MLSKSTVIGTLMAGGIAVAGLGTAAAIRPTQAQNAGPSAAPPGGTNQAPKESTRVQINNVKHVLLAVHNYISTNDRLPAAATHGGDGRPTLSWRIALLPYLGHNDLYEQFHKDEAWDSPHNKALIDRMPAVFETPDAPAPRGQTRFRGFAGAGTLFEGVQGVTLRDVTDGTSNTVFLAVARDATPWTKPGELPVVPGQPLPPLDERNPDGYMLGMTDGSVRTLPRDKTSLLPYLITRAGGEVIDWQPPPPAVNAVVLRPTPAPWPTAAPVPMPNATPAPAVGMMGVVMTPPNASPAPAATLEERLQRVEDKLDRVLQRLDAAFPVSGGAAPSGLGR